MGRTQNKGQGGEANRQERSIIKQSQNQIKNQTRRESVCSLAKVPLGNQFPLNNMSFTQKNRLPF